MAPTVRARVLVKPRTLEAREFARPTIGRDDGLLRIEACGICGSDYEQYEGAQPAHQDYTPYPVIPGHEPLGVIEELGTRARQRWGVKEGDRVAVRSGYGCGKCEACARGEPMACPRRGGTYGYTDVGKPPYLWGGYAEQMYLSPHTVLKKMDPKIPAGVAVLFNPLAAGLSWAAAVPRTGPGDRVVILGAGQRGLCAVIGARAAGARQVVITGLGRAAAKLALARDDGIYKGLPSRGVLSMPVDVTFQAIELIEAGRYPFEKMHTSSLPLEQAEDAIHMLAGKIPGVNPIHLAIVPGAPRVDWR